MLRGCNCRVMIIFIAICNITPSYHIQMLKVISIFVQQCLRMLILCLRHPKVQSWAQIVAQ